MEKYIKNIYYNYIGYREIHEHLSLINICRVFVSQCEVFRRTSTDLLVNLRGVNRTAMRLCES